ncbi:transcriptional regulator domain-containing protein [Asticcacaulis machinosus]|uniref:DUF6499 domain-containing protein n=1 Tax=Asticcacaulis machinosus TaxID=2984211 RepID=A0ABT5HH43_9CAUL|nr:DUF6499 domain-containing protein [Asticcacaulis machinosus]MDC7675513.1 DUF6499 domain-containing protein [Asticcacaulis machinosus]
MLPDPSQWRSDHAYAYFDDLPPEGLAWECLRRNRHYQTEVRNTLLDLSRHAPVPEAFIETWGLRSPGATEPKRP